MRSHFLARISHTIMFVATIMFTATSARADEPKPLVRELFVPFDDLNVILEAGGRRVFLTREEYDDLLKRARKTEAEAAPRAYALTAAEYDAQIEEGRAVIRGNLSLEVTQDGLHAIPLPLSGVGVRKATLDGEPAAIGRSQAAAQAALFVSGRGQHELELEMVAPLEVAAPRQILRFQLPHAATGRMRLAVPGNIELKSGATVLRQEFDENQNVTRFELLPTQGMTTLVMSLNNREVQNQQVVVARNVFVSELTETYERLHMTASLQVLHGAVEQFRFAIPAGFEVIDVATPLLSRWQVNAEQDQRILSVTMREPASGTVVLNIAAQRTAPELQQWELPQVRPLDVVGSVSIVGILVENRLQTQSLQPDNLISIDTDVLAETLPATIFAAEPGAPPIQPVAAYYAPQADFEIAGTFAKPEGRVHVVSNTVLVISDSGLEVRGGFALLPIAEKIFGCHFTVPTGWRVTEVTYGGGQPLPFERYDESNGSGRVDVILPQSVSPGEAYSIYFRATYTPAGWLDVWQTQQVSFPEFTIVEATSDRGAIAVQARDDLVVKTQSTAGLVPLDANRKTEFDLQETPASLALQFDARPFAAVLDVERTSPRLTAETYSFLTVAPGKLSAHYELIYDVQEARTRELSFRLPLDTPAEISVRGLDETVVKEFNSVAEDESRLWKAQLASPTRGNVRLEASFVLPIPSTGGAFETPAEGPETTDGNSGDASTAATSVTLPIIVAENVEFQTGTIAIEGSAELEVSLKTAARKVDAGELVDADYQPSRRLLGVYGFVGDVPAITAQVARPPQHALPAAIVERAELVTAVSQSGISQSAARFHLRTKASFIEVQLPAASTLWSVYLDGTASKPQRDGGRLLISLPITSAAQLRDLQLVYETPVTNMHLWSRLEVVAPQLFLRNAAEESASAPLPTADLIWYLHIPPGFRLAATDGTVFPDLRDAATRQQLAETATPAIRVARTVASSPGPFRLLLADRRFEGVTNQAGTQGVPASGRVLIEAEPGEFEGLHEGAAGETMQSGRARGNVDFDTDMFGAASDPAVPTAPAPRMAVPQDAPPAAGDEGFQFGQPFASSATAAPAEQPAADSSATAKYWALEGLRSLRIDLSTSGAPLLFQSLGADARLDVKLVDGSRLELLAAGIALIVGLLGIGLIARSWPTKLTYIAAVLVFASLIPLVTGWDRELGPAFDWSFYTGLLLIPVYLLRQFCRWSSGFFASSSAAATALSIVVIMALTASPRCAHAQAPETTLGPLHIKLLDSLPPVNVPEDAIIVPYNPDGGDAAVADRVIIPYNTYERLWKRAFPDRYLEASPPPAPYALAGVKWETRLEDLDHLEVTGSILVDVYVDKDVTVLLPFDGGVLTRSEVEGRPARVQLLATEVPAQQESQVDQVPMPAQNAAPRPTPMMLAVHLAGSGRKEIALAARLPLARRGGWRIAQGQLPAAQATSLQAVVPLAGTEVRLRDVEDRTDYLTTAANEAIATALGTQGTFHIQWRPQVTQIDVDTALTVTSEAVVDVQEDTLRALWRMQLSFPRGERDAFELQVPAEYLVEKVAGDNILSWQNNAGRLEIRLLKATRDTQQITVQLTKPSGMQVGETTNVEVPVLGVVDAALHEGRLAVRRSPLIELRAIETQSVVRTDIASVQAARDETVTSPLGIRPFQAYQFAQTPFLLRLGATPLATRISAEMQTVLRIGQSERTLECRAMMQIRGKPAHALQFDLPGELAVEQVSAPEPFQWSVSDGVDPPRLNVFFGAGQVGSFSVVIRGRLGERGAVSTVSLPRIYVDGAVRQNTTIVVQTDPSYNAAAEQLTGCETILLRQTHGWLTEQQRPLARLAVRCGDADFGGQILLTRRTPRVTCQTVSNVRVTSRAFEETVLLDYTIRDAGVREVSFLLPSDLRNARVNAPLLRSKSVEDVDGDPALVRVRLELQDEVIGQFRVLVEHDRLLSAELRAVPIPVVESARVEQQFVALESAGRDEVIVDSQQQLEPLSRQQEKWRTLAAILGDGVTQAFLAETGADAPRLVVRTQDRQAVETVGARIAFAQTTLTVDASGAYRGTQQYQVDNRTEQFLAVELPVGAQLWTARVAGEAVKPIIGQQGQIRVPLVKTAEGEQDYAVELKYGGRMAGVGRLANVDFPLIQTVNINVELSQVRLYVPDTHRWFGFSGTMRRVDADEDFIASYLRYKTEQLTTFSKSLASENPYARVRALSNLKQLTSEVEQLQAQTRDYRGLSKELDESLTANTTALQRAKEALQIQADQQLEIPSVNNRRQLNAYFSYQDNSVSRNLVNEQSDNFDIQTAASPEDDRSGGREGQVQRQWFEAYQLRNESLDAKRLEPEGENRVQLKAEKAKDTGIVSGKLNRYSLQVMPQGAPQKPPTTAEPVSPRGRGESRSRDAGVDKVERFEQRLEEQQKGLPSSDTDDLFDVPQSVDRSREDADGIFDQESAVSGPETAGPQFRVPVARGSGLGGGGLGGGFLGQATGFASLDVQLPQRGTEYRFTTPRGDIKIQARAIDDSLWLRLRKLAIVTGLILLVAACVRIIRRVGYGGIVGPKLAILLIVIGLLMLVLGVAPLLGVILILAGNMRFALGNSASETRAVT